MSQTRTREAEDYSPLVGLGARQPPQNIQAEQALLGAILANNRAYRRVSDFLLPEHFAYPIHGKIFQCVSRMIEAGELADGITVRGELEGAGILEEVGGMEYIADLLASMVGIINAGEYGRVILECYLRRDAIEVARTLIERAFGQNGDMQIGRALGEAREHVDRIVAASAMNGPAYVGTNEALWVDSEKSAAACEAAGYGRVFNASTLMTLRDGKQVIISRAIADRLAAIEKFILIPSTDVASRAAMEEVARRIGRHKCWRVVLPEGCENAADVADLIGPDVLQQMVRDATPYPIDGVQKVKPGMLRELRRLGDPVLLTTGCAATDAIIRLPGEGRLIVITGLPNHGKSSWLTQLAVHTAKQHDRKWMLFSPEMQPWEEYAAQCAQVLTGKRFRQDRWEPGMSDEELEEAERWLADRLTFLVSDAEEEPPTLDWIFDRARAAVLRDGLTDLGIDPWNEVEHDRGSLTQTEYIGRSLQRAKAFGMRYGCNVWILAHPSKMKPPRPGEPIPVPGLYDIEWSAAWGNKSDLGFAVHTDSSQTSIHVLKSRFYRWSRKGMKADLEFDPYTGRYRSPAPAQAVMAPPDQSGRWGGDR